METTFDAKYLSEKDIEYETDLKQYPFYLKGWLYYLDAKQEEIDEIENSEDDKSKTRQQLILKEKERQKLIKIKFLIYERALKNLPGSYKLWYNYLQDRINFTKNLIITHKMIEETNNCFERCLMFLHKMPRIWMMYAEYLTNQRYITRTRIIFDKALKSLPITQHDRIWPLYIKFVRIVNVCNIFLLFQVRGYKYIYI